MIDPHVASSSPAVSSGRSEPQQNVDVDLGRPQAAVSGLLTMRAYEKLTRAPMQPDSDGSSTSTGAATLSAIDALDEGGAEDEIETFTFVDSAQHDKREHKRESAALVEVPVPGRKTRKSEATTTSAGAGE